MATSRRWRWPISRRDRYRSARAAPRLSMLARCSSPRWCISTSETRAPDLSGRARHEESRIIWLPAALANAGNAASSRGLDHLRRCERDQRCEHSGASSNRQPGTFALCPTAKAYIFAVAKQSQAKKKDSARAGQYGPPSARGEGPSWIEGLPARREAIEGRGEDASREAIGRGAKPSRKKPSLGGKRPPRELPAPKAPPAEGDVQPSGPPESEPVMTGPSPGPVHHRKPPR